MRFFIRKAVAQLRGQRSKYNLFKILKFGYFHNTMVDPKDSGYKTTIFDKIIAKEIPSKIIYEDDLCLAFRDINPQAPTHFLVIPRKKDGLDMLEHATEKHKEVLGHMMVVCAKVAKQEKLAKGWRLVINNGPDGL